MLVDFSVENLLSFNERTSFSMVAGKERLKPEHKNTSLNSISTLKLATIFGANASGKSNLIKAIELGKKLITKEIDLTSKQASPFKLTEKPNPISTLEYKIQHKGYTYIYGFSFNSIKFSEEWLYLLKSRKGDAELVFDRKFIDNSTPEIEIGRFFKKRNIEITKAIFSNYKDDSLLISLIDQFNFNDESEGFNHLNNIFDWFTNSLTVIYPKSKATEGIQHELNNNSDFREVFSRFLNSLDTGIDNISFKEIKRENLSFPEKFLDKITSTLLKKGTEKNTASISDVAKGELILVKRLKEDQIKFYKLVTQRKILGTDKLVDFDSTDEESDGTKRLFDLIPILASAVKGDNVVIVDEIERSLHPNLVQSLIHYYLLFAKESNSQMILATHESALLDQEMLRRDEIWFISKTKCGSSSLHSLSEYNERFDRELRKNYLNGRFNGIPNLSEVNGKL
ncbi:AAA family ATPase [Acinetobacter courvalinii]|uniref:AAA family ATPase n=1 Tax=Acinetobacter courvalinii TaxID=280147 RepID=UPI00289CB26F|nr:ATP-binding protein [Acinetobacter courvalinii]